MISYSNSSLLHDTRCPACQKNSPCIALDVTVSAAKTAFVKEILKPYLLYVKRPVLNDKNAFASYREIIFTDFSIRYSVKGIMYIVNRRQQCQQIDS